jgi:hypothetical protein
MAALVGMVALVGVLLWAAPRYGLYNTSPLHVAFTFTAAGLLFLTTGLLGFAIRKSAGIPYLQSVGIVVWSQVWLGMGCSVLATVLWWRALKTV